MLNEVLYHMKFFIHLSLVVTCIVVAIIFFGSSVKKTYAVTNSCATTGCCNNTDHDAYDSKYGLKVTTAPQITCSGTTCSAKITLPTSTSAYNAIVWFGPGQCTSPGYCLTRPFQGNTKTLTGLQQGKTYGFKVTTSNSSGSIISGYGVENTGGSCNYNFVATVAAPKPTTTTSPSPSISPSVSPSISPTPHTFLNIALRLPGIGISGNLSPQHTTRTTHLTIYKDTDDATQPNVAPLYSATNVTLTYDPNSGYFKNTHLDIGTNLITGNYQVFIKAPSYLRKVVSSGSSITTNPTVTITEKTTNTLPSITAIPGDTAPIYNVMDASDFYAIVSCYGSKSSTSTCAAGSQITDLNDDGKIDGVDLNLWLIGMQTLLQASNATGNGDGPVGN